MRVAVIGVGNVLYKDEGIGVYALRFLEKNYDLLGNVTLVDGGTLGFKLIEYILDFDNIIILDTLSIKEKPGTIYSIPALELIGLGEHRQTSHEIEVISAIEMSMLYEKRADISIVGIIPEDITSVEIDLTDTLKENFDSFVEAALKELEKAGIASSPKKMQNSIESIICSYSAPSRISLYD